MSARSVISKPAFHDCYGCDTEIFILDTLERSFFLSFGCAGEEACGMIKKKKRGEKQRKREKEEVIWSIEITKLKQTAEIAVYTLRMLGE